MKPEEIVYYNNLYDYYGELLTEKQRKYFEDYYFSNLSFKEMSENYGISRNAAFKQLQNTLTKLKHYEEILKLYEKKEKLNEIVKDIENNELKEKLIDLF